MHRNPRLIGILLLCLSSHLYGQTPDAQHPSSITTIAPFFVFGDLILIIAQADEKEGYFILDTGAPGLILNKRHFHEGAKALKGPHTSFGLNGEVKDIRTRDVDLMIGDRHWKNVYACLYDLEYLEKAKNITILGLVGSLLFRDMELAIDFERKELVISPLDNDGEWADDNYFYRQADVVIPFKKKGHMPYIEATVEGNTLNLGIDSGAGIGLIVNTREEALIPYSEPGEAIRIRGLGQNTLLTKTVYLRNLTVANLSYTTLKVAFADLSYINDYFAGLDLDGILGLDLLSQHRTAINFKKKEIYIWIPKENSDQFVLVKPQIAKDARN